MNIERRCRIERNVPEHPFVKPPKERSKLDVLVSVFKYLSQFYSWLFPNKKAQNAKEIEKAKKELQKALAEGRIQDVAFWRRKIQTLSRGTVVILTSLTAMILMGCLTGCLTSRQETQPQALIIGERLYKLTPGEAVTVPPLVKPAKQWYLVDDVGLFQWIEVQP